MGVNTYLSIQARMEKAQYHSDRDIHKLPNKPVTWFKEMEFR